MQTPRIDNIYCHGKDCPLKDDCKRYSPTADGVRLISPYNVFLRNCKHFIKKTKGKVERAIEAFDNLSADEMLDAIYLPLCLEYVAIRYLDSLRAYLFIPGDKDAKWLSREIDEAIRIFERGVPNGVPDAQMTKKNVKRLDDICLKAMPRKFLYKKDSPYTPFVGAVANAVSNVCPDGLPHFNGYETDTIAKAYFCYRLMHFAMEAEGYSVAKVTGDLKGWHVPQYLANIGATCLILIEYLGGCRPKPTESRQMYRDRILRTSPMLDELDKTTYDATLKLIDELDKFHIEK